MKVFRKEKGDQQVCFNLKLKIQVKAAHPAQKNYEQTTRKRRASHLGGDNQASRT